jgi:hypothetical protein
MIYRVRLMAFGDGKIREVNVPDVTTNNIEEVLDLVYHYGQNEIQPLLLPSVSVGDVIEAGDRLFVVKLSGFAEMTKEEFSKYEKVPLRDRPLYHYRDL